MLETDDTTPRKRKKAHRFDRVIKENLEGLFDPLAAKLFGIDRAETEALRAVLKDKLHVTLEREADYLKRFTYPDNPNQDHIFHLEIQSTPGRAMLHRMLLYYAMLLTIYRVPVRQCILYIGNDSVQVLRRILRHPNLRFRFEVFDIRDYAADLFLDSSNPAEIILAILANFGNATATEIVARIVERLRTCHLDDPDLQRYLRQLHIIAELRKLESFTAPIIENMPVALNITIDPYYKKGIEEGIEKGIEKGKAEGKTEATQATREEYTKRMLTKGLGITEISDLLGIDFEFVQRIAAAMNRKD